MRRAGRYARGSRAWGHCARTGDRVLLSDLVRDGQTGLLVTREAYEPKHPQENVIDAFDPQLLRRRSPDRDNSATILTTTFTWDPGLITEGAIEAKTDIVVTGATVGDTVIPFPGVSLAGLLVSAHVSAPNTVTVVLANLGATQINLASSTWGVLVTPERYDRLNTFRDARFQWDPSVLADGTTENKAVSVTGTTVGDAVLIYPGAILGSLLISGYVSAADTVTAVVANLTGGQVDATAQVWPPWHVATTPISSIGSARFFLQPSLSTTFTWDPGSVPDGAVEEKSDITVTGAAIGDAVVVYPGASLQGLRYSGHVNATDTVSVVLSNLTGAAVDLDSATWGVRVLTRW